MANNATFEEVIRLAFEVGGDEGIRQAAQTLAQLGDVSEEARAQASALLEAIASSDKSAKAIEAYREQGKAVFDYQARINAATKTVTALKAEIAATESPTKRQTKALEAAKAALSALYQEQQGPITKLRETKAALDASGVSLKSFAAAQSDIAGRTAAAGASLRTLVEGLKAERDAAEAARATEVTHQRQLLASTAQAEAYADALKAAFAGAESALKRAAGDLAGSGAGTATAQGLERAQAALRGFVSESQAELGRLREIDAELKRTGASTAELVTSQALLGRRSREVAAQTEALTDALGRARTAEAGFQRELVAERERAGGQERQYQEALKRTQAQLERNGKAAEDGGHQAVEGLERTRGAAERLRGVLAGLAAFFSFEGLKEGVKSILSTGDEFAKFEKQLTNLYGTQAKGRDAFDWVKTFTKETPLQLQDVMKSFITLKNFGIDPMNGSLHAIVDQNAKLGGESERLERITLALGQAFAKGKLQGEEIMQLVEASVPVYQILGEVTGKTAGELQNLASAGKLGTDVLAKFVAQMGKDSLGAAVEQAGLLSGQFTVLKDNIQQFEDEVAKGGFMSFVRDQLKALNDQFSRASADGSLKRYADQISAGLTSIGKGLKSATLFAIEHAQAIGNIVKAYAAFKIGSVVGELAVGAARLIGMAKAAVETQRELGGVASKATVLTKILRSIPANVQIAIAVAGFELLKEAGETIGEFAGKHSAAQKSLDAALKRQHDATVEQARAYQQAAAEYDRYKDVQVKGAADIASMHTRERAAYEAQLKGFVAYADAQYQAQLHLSQIGEASADDLNKASAAMQSAHRAVNELAAGVKVANDALSRGLPVAAAAAQDKLEGIGTDAEAASTRLAELFQSFQTSSITQLGDLALGIAKAGAESQVAGATIREALGGALEKLSAEDLLKFQSAATAAMHAYQVSAQDAQAVVQPLLEQGLARLGVAADRWGLAGTEAGRANTAAFQVVAENAVATGQQIEAAFNRALANATTVQDAQAIGDAMAAAGQQGKVGFDATERSVAAVANRIRQLQTALDPLADSFAQLGIQSKRALDDAAAAATSSMASIVSAYHQGKASIEDVRSAFTAYSKAQLDAAANSDTWKRDTVQAALQTQAAVLGVYNGLNDMGDAGLEAGGKIARGAGHARDALDDTAAAAHRSAAANEEFSESADDAAESDIHFSEAADRSAAAARRHAKETEAMSYSLGGLSDQLVKDLAALNQFAINPTTWRTMWNNTMEQATAQLNQFRGQLATLQAANAQFDPLAQKIAALRSDFKYLNDDQLSALAQAQTQLEQRQQQARDEAKRREQESNDIGRQRAEAWSSADAGDGDRTAGAAPAGPLQVALDLNVNNRQRDGGASVTLDDDQIRRIVRAATPALTKSIVRQLGLLKASVNR